MKEPIQKKWIWVGFVLLILFNAPWYLPEGMIEPYILGIPLWALISVGLSLILCAYLSWLCMTQWNLIEDEEEEEFEKERRQS
ncbi:hypothetical protein DH09_10505 [Bacillaceae bacterium JMAK1]|nr:hypothetical protein DH09_10505 [Bacillaceae bacterium JMAK1]